MDFGMLDCPHINCITLIATEGKVGYTRIGILKLKIFIAATFER